MGGHVACSVPQLRPEPALFCPFSGPPALLRRMGKISYVGSVKDESLESYLSEALYLLELRFKAFDLDGAGCLEILELGSVWRADFLVSMQDHSIR